MLARLTAPSTQKHLTCIVWPDSGADHCLLPVSFALALGLDLLKMPRQVTGGVGNTGNVTYYEKVDIDLGIGVELNALAGFTAGMEAHGIGPVIWHTWHRAIPCSWWMMPVMPEDRSREAWS